MIQPIFENPSGGVFRRQQKQRVVKSCDVRLLTVRTDSSDLIRKDPLGFPPTVEEVEEIKRNFNSPI